MPEWSEATALIVVDVQRGFENEAHFGTRNNPGCEMHIGMLLEAWTKQGWPIVYVRHDSKEEDSPLAPGTWGNAFQPTLSAAEPHLLVVKSVHSAFFGEPDMHGWLQQHGIRSVAICGIQTNVCCETTARMASDLGYDTLFVIDATHTFDLPRPDGSVIEGDDLAATTAAVLAAEFATVVYTSELVG
jgi:nicotinamidase-related amidase